MESWLATSEWLTNWRELGRKWFGQSEGQLCGRPAGTLLPHLSVLKICGTATQYRFPVCVCVHVATCLCILEDKFWSCGDGSVVKSPCHENVKNQVQVPRIHVSARWGWQPSWTSGLRRKRWTLQSKPARETSHIGELWVWLWESVSMITVDEWWGTIADINFGPPFAFSHTYVYINM